jgi:hypothetical protein
MNNLASMLLLALAASCSKGDAKPEPTTKPVEPAKTETKPAETKVAPKPTETPKAEAPKAEPPKAKLPTGTVSSDDPEGPMKLMKHIATKQLTLSHFEVNRKFVEVDLTGKTPVVKAFSSDDQVERFTKLPERLAADYGQQIANAESLPEGVLDCKAHVGNFTLCEVTSQGEDESSLTFLVAKEEWAYVIAGVAKRTTHMIDPSSGKIDKDEKARNAAFAQATTDDCFMPESARGGRMPKE